MKKIGILSSHNGSGYVTIDNACKDGQLDAEVVVVISNNSKATVIDLRTLQPWDKNAIYEQVKRCNKVLLLTEDTLTGSIIHDIASHIAHDCFQHLDAPIKTIGSLDTPVPMAKNLEDLFLPWERFKEALKDLLAY